MVYLSICLCHLWFLSSASHSFQRTGSFASIGLPRCFALFDFMVSLISLFDISLLVYRNATDFCLLIFYPATLPNVAGWADELMSSSSFSVAPLGFSMFSIMLSENSDSFATSFTIWIPFIIFSSLIAVARASNTMLNKSSRSEHPYLVLDVREHSLRFLPLSIMLAVHLLLCWDTFPLCQLSGEFLS